MPQEGYNHNPDTCPYNPDNEKNRIIGMCLTVNNINNCFRYASEDIVCYKVLHLLTDEERYIINETNRYVTPYKFIGIPDEVLDGKSPFKALGKCHTIYKDNECFINGGYIHTFAEYPKEWIDNHKIGYVVFRCVIPKGTRYAKGYFCGVDAYASKEIMFIEEIKKK